MNVRPARFSRPGEGGIWAGREPPRRQDEEALRHGRRDRWGPPAVSPRPTGGGGPGCRGGRRGEVECSATRATYEDLGRVAKRSLKVQSRSAPPEKEYE